MKRFLISVFCIFVLVVYVNWKAKAETAYVVPVHQDYGGEVDVYLREIQRDVNNDVIYAIDGKCFSACTMRMSRACVYPSALFGFHSPYIPKEYEQNYVAIMRGRDIMLSTYPGFIRKWVEANKALETSKHVYLSGSDAIKLGMVDCRTIL